MRLGSEAPTSFKSRMCLMSPDRLWSFLWGELLLLPAQMWRDLNMTIWSRKPHAGLHAHAVTYVLVHSSYLQHTQAVVSEGLGKGHPAVLSSPPTCSTESCKYGSLEWPVVPLCQQVPFTYISHASCVPVEQN